MMRPFSIALTMEQKLSSVRIMSEAPLATSVPSRPMATPISARLRAGASLTPSPVIATISPASLRSRTMSCLCLGSARENTQPPGDDSVFFFLARGMSANSRPVNDRPTVSFALVKMPMSAQMASAVSLLSPVMTTTRIPAVLQSSMAPRTSGRGGSRRPARPQKVKSLSMDSYLAGSMRSLCAACVSVPSYEPSLPSSAPVLSAKPRQRRALEDISPTVAMISLRKSSERETTDPSGSKTLVHRSRTHSGAPLTSSEFLPLPAPSETMTDMLLRPRSNSNVASLAPFDEWYAATPPHPLAGSLLLSLTILAFAAESSTPIFSARTLSAPSVGSPAHLNWPSLSSMVLSLHMTHILETALTHASSAPPLSPTTPPSLGS
mmetsp:Transcript_9478/g.43130  ORF Transcript_9478/g.43130 Transcript_9478/m.43130 type:complete len:379 (+) Transcript_9478:1216-2352(+)